MPESQSTRASADELAGTLRLEPETLTLAGGIHCLAVASVLLERVTRALELGEHRPTPTGDLRDAVAAAGRARVLLEDRLTAQGDKPIRRS